MLLSTILIVIAIIITGYLVFRAEKMQTKFILSQAATKETRNYTAKNNKNNKRYGELASPYGLEQSTNRHEQTTPTDNTPHNRQHTTPDPESQNTSRQNVPTGSSERKQNSQTDVRNSVGVDNSLTVQEDILNNDPTGPNSVMDKTLDGLESTDPVEDIMQRDKPQETANSNTNRDDIHRRPGK